MVNLLRMKVAVSREEAYMLVSLNGGLRICQACEGPMNPTVKGRIAEAPRNTWVGYRQIDGVLSAF
jgi:acetamidase/formamidase